MVIIKRDKNIFDHLGNEYEKVNTYHYASSQESQKALFSIFSGLVGMLSLMQSTQVPTLVNYYLPTFIFYFLWRYISISNAIIRAFFIYKTPLYVNINMHK
jgi:hypothetical protein